MAHILLTEDDDAVRAFVKRALELDGHKVLTAEDGLAALEIISERNGEFDLLVSDIVMPGMDGLELTEALIGRYPNLPILLMTGYANQRERAEHITRRVYDILSKPFSLAEIRSKVGEAISMQPVLQEKRQLAG